MYNQTYDNENIRNKRYSVIPYIKQFYKKDYVCLDLGCGSCRKIIPILELVKHYYAVDIDRDRVKSAKELCKNKNITIGVANNFYLPFKDAAFDLVSCFMTKYSIEEVSRVLKKDGLLIVETQGADDKRELKKIFGKDELGWRGTLLPDNTKNRIDRLTKYANTFFEIDQLHQIKFNTKIKLQYLIELFEMTNEIRNFNKNKDIKILENILDQEGYVEFEEDRIIIVAHKK